MVAGDVNEGMSHSSIKHLFSRHEMKHCVFLHHGSSNAPPTHVRLNGRTGDGIWATPGINVVQAGYLEPGDFPGDHATLWVDITYESALGREPPPSRTFQALCLVLQHSMATKRHLDCYEREVERLRLKQCQNRLEASTTVGAPLTEQQAKEAEKTDALKQRQCSKQKNR